MEQKIAKPQTNHLISKHNALVEAKYRLSLQEQRIIAFMCAEIKPEDKDFKPYRFVIKDFAELIGLLGENYYSQLKKVTRSLTTRGLTLREGNKEIQLTWLCAATYHKKEGYVELQFHPYLKPYLLHLRDCFTQYQLGEILKLRSKYAFRLYELCKKNELLGKYKYEIEQLRELLGVVKGELKLWADFRRRCLEPAIKEINKKTDLKIKYSTEKLGRRIRWIIFNIKKKENKENLKKIDNNTPINKLIKLIPEKHRRKKTIKTALIKAYKKHGFEYCKRNIEYANERATENYRSYIIQALKEDWALGWSEDQKDKEEVKNIATKIKNTKIQINGELYETNEEGFIFMKNGVMPPGELIKLLKEGKAKLIEEEK